MKQEKMQIMILAVVLILVISVALILNTENGHSPTGNGDVVVTGDWIDLSSNINTVATGYDDYSDIFFVNENEGWVTSSTVAEIYHTTDGGETWNVQTTPLGTTNAIHMLDEKNGYSGGAGGWVYNTINGGDNWNFLASMGNLADISFPPNTNPNNPIGYASGNSGNVWEITSTLTNLNSPSRSHFSGISAPSVNNAWACGGNRIYYYDGTNFDSQVGPVGTFNDNHFITNQEGWVVGNQGVIGHTTDGETWVTQINPDTQKRSLYCVFFFDSNKGWAVGVGGVILHTTNGGNPWTVEADGQTSNFLRGISAPTSDCVYICGNKRTLLKYVAEK